MKQTQVPVLLVVLAGGFWLGCEQQEMKVSSDTGPYMYTVREGDASFRQIAERVYGDGRYGNHIAEANPDVSPDELEPGQRLTIPQFSEKITPMKCNRQRTY